jgi:hypothetical protein
MFESNDAENNVSQAKPVNFLFKPVNIIAKGRMEAGIAGVESGKWVITMGQNLIGGDQGKARVRPVRNCSLKNPRIKL